MSLASALSTTKNILGNTSTQTAVLSTNIQNVSNTDYNRRTATTATNLYSGATTIAIDRTQDAALLKQTLSATSDNSGQQTLLAGLESVYSMLGGDGYSLAPSTALSSLRDALQNYAATPGDVTLAKAAVNSAVDLATVLNDNTQQVQQLRADADSQIGSQVSTLNGLLSQFKDANDKVMAATASGADPSNALDTRESLLKQISSIVGITTSTSDNNSISIYTSDGITLFETTPRTISFDQRAGYDATAEGNGIYIDGVELQAGEGADSTAQGSLQALLQLRDEVYPGYQDQLDEIARGVTSLFAETDGSSPIAGLFTSSDEFADAASEAVSQDPDDPQIITGLAGLITVNPAVIADPNLLRDGSIAGVSQNSEDASGFSDLLNSYVAGFETTMNFDPAANIGNSATLLDFSTDSIGWVEEYRSGATDASETTSAMVSRTQEAYSNSTGVNLDEELILLLDVEQSYKAASKLLTTIDDMLAALMQAAN